MGMGGLCCEWRSPWQGVSLILQGCIAVWVHSILEKRHSDQVRGPGSGYDVIDGSLQYWPGGKEESVLSFRYKCC